MALTACRRIFSHFTTQRYGFFIYFHEKSLSLPREGELSEWLKEPASKTGVPQGTGGSNPSLTAVKVDNQPIKRFTHKPTHTKAKFVRISIYEINGYCTRLE